MEIKVKFSKTPESAVMFSLHRAEVAIIVMLRELKHPT